MGSGVELMKSEVTTGQIDENNFFLEGVRSISSYFFGRVVLDKLFQPSGLRTVEGIRSSTSSEWFDSVTDEEVKRS